MEWGIWNDKSIRKGHRTKRADTWVCPYEWAVLRHKGHSTLCPYDFNVTEKDGRAGDREMQSGKCKLQNGNTEGMGKMEQQGRDVGTELNFEYTIPVN